MENGFDEKRDSKKYTTVTVTDTVTDRGRGERVGGGLSSDTRGLR